MSGKGGEMDGQQYEQRQVSQSIAEQAEDEEFRAQAEYEYDEESA
jgi:hypothetical protein